jgi:transcriptional regulator with XRE-family HTH domain
LKIRKEVGMLIFMDNTIKFFVVGLKQWAKTKPHRKTQAEIAAAVKKTQPTISDYFNLKYLPDPEHINMWVRVFGLDEEQIIALGKKTLGAENSVEDRINALESKISTPALNATASEQPPQSLYSEHQKMVERFKDKAWGQYVNALLLEIEELDPDAKTEITGILQEKLKYLRGKSNSRQDLQEESSAS